MTPMSWPIWILPKHSGLYKQVSPITGGYGYEIRPAGQCESAKQLASETSITRIRRSELELVSTIVYIDREALSTQERLQNEELVQRVRDVKPPEEQVRNQVRVLNEKNILMT